MSKISRVRDLVQASVFVVGSVWAAGCGTPAPVAPAPDGIALEAIPAAVMALAREKLPGVDFERAWVEKEDDGELAYEIRGRTEEGRTREIKISASGRVIEIE